MDLTIHEQLLVARKRAGLSIRDLAKRSNISTAEICLIEHGKRSPTLRTLAKLAVGLGCTIQLEFLPVEQ